MNKMDNKTLYYAKRYIDLGFSPIPIRPDGKAPAVSFKDMDKTTYEHANEWWGNHPDWKIALRTIDFLVVDVDVNHGETGINGFDVIDKYKKEGWWNDNTLTATTPNGGKHYYYLKPKDKKLKQSLGRVDSNHPGVDVKANVNNYVLCYPSSKNNGKMYSWDNITEYFNFKSNHLGKTIIKGYTISPEGEYIEDKNYNGDDKGHMIKKEVKPIPKASDDLLSRLDVVQQEHGKSSNKYKTSNNQKYKKITKNKAKIKTMESLTAYTIFYYLSKGLGNTKEEQYKTFSFIIINLIFLGIDVESINTSLEKNNILLSEDEQLDLYMDILDNKFEYYTLKTRLNVELPYKRYDAQKLVDTFTLIANGFGNEGGRNDLLYSTTCRMKAWGIDDDIITDLMMFANANTCKPLPDNEVDATIWSALNR